MGHLESQEPSVSARPASSAARPPATTKQRASLRMAWDARNGRVTTELVSFVRWACCAVFCAQQEHVPYYTALQRGPVEVGHLEGHGHGVSPRPPSHHQAASLVRVAWGERIVAAVFYHAQHRLAFNGATVFNGDLSKWDTAKVATMS